MKEIILIFMLSNSHGVGPTAIPGFSSIEKCEQAAKVISADIDKLGGWPKEWKKRYTCTVIEK